MSVHDFVSFPELNVSGKVVDIDPVETNVDQEIVVKSGVDTNADTDNYRYSYDYLRFRIYLNIFYGTKQGQTYETILSFFSTNISKFKTTIRQRMKETNINSN